MLTAAGATELSVRYNCETNDECGECRVTGLDWSGVGFDPDEYRDAIKVLKVTMLGAQLWSALGEGRSSLIQTVVLEAATRSEHSRGAGPRGRRYDDQSAYSLIDKIVMGFNAPTVPFFTFEWGCCELEGCRDWKFPGWYRTIDRWDCELHKSKPVKYAFGQNRFDHMLWSAQPARRRAMQLLAMMKDMEGLMCNAQRKAAGEKPMKAGYGCD